MAKKFIVGNWKMNPESASSARVLWNAIKKVSVKSKNTIVVMCVPFVYLPQLKSVSSARAILGAQNVWYEKSGAYTGEVSPKMLKDFGVKYTIVGHSERRAIGETSEIIAKKVNALLKVGVVPILCIGEKDRDHGGEYLNFIKKQLMDSLNEVPKSSIKNIAIAYEPIWAIGKNATREATAHESLEVALFIRKVLSDMSDAKSAHATKILYGGSVTKENAKDFLENGGVDGLLVGRASLSVKDFTKIIQDADQTK